MHALRICHVPEDPIRLHKALKVRPVELERAVVLDRHEEDSGNAADAVAKAALFAVASVAHAEYNVT